jgi:hypothetical protein
MRFFYRTFIVLVSLLYMVSSSYAQKDNYQSFGEKITAEPAITVQDLLAAMEGKDSVEAKISGQISNVCQMKGCWMNISNRATEEESVFVQFKDYAFFVPKDASGKEVIIEGLAYRKITPVDELRHYAEDAGQSKEEIAAITEPKEEIRFMAKGVLIRN